MYLLQYDARLFRPEQKDQTLRHPTQDLRLVPFRLIHKDRIPIFPDHTIRLHEMHQNQSNPTLREINEFQKSSANPKKVFLYVHHKIFLDPNTPNAR
ncbi:hypothetical protein IC582_031713 [Cucumis melo]